MPDAIKTRIPPDLVSGAELPEPEFRYTIFIAKPAPEVWKALTEKEIIDQYYLAPVHTLELEKGGAISYGGETEVISGTITELVVPEELVHTFKFVGSDDAATKVSYTIDAFGDSVCSLTIAHTGFQKEDQSFANITGGWPIVASSLKTLLETGKGLPWAEGKGE